MTKANPHKVRDHIREIKDWEANAVMNLPLVVDTMQIKTRTEFCLYYYDSEEYLAWLFQTNKCKA